MAGRIIWLLRKKVKVSFLLRVRVCDLGTGGQFEGSAIFVVVSLYYPSLTLPGRTGRGLKSVARHKAGYLKLFDGKNDFRTGQLRNGQDYSVTEEASPLKNIKLRTIIDD